jgi:hypothetical protein
MTRPTSHIWGVAKSRTGKKSLFPSSWFGLSILLVPFCPWVGRVTCSAWFASPPLLPVSLEGLSPGLPSRKFQLVSSVLKSSFGLQLPHICFIFQIVGNLSLEEQLQDSTTSWSLLLHMLPTTFQKENCTGHRGISVLAGFTFILCVPQCHQS